MYVFVYVCVSVCMYVYARKGMCTCLQVSEEEEKGGNSPGVGLKASVSYSKWVLDIKITAGQRSST